MSNKLKGESSMSTRSARNRTKKTPQVQNAPRERGSGLQKDEVALEGSPSPLEALYQDPTFRLEWDNDARFHIAENVIRLRRLRGESQASVATAMNTSQSAVARIENETGNLTIETLTRLATALRGRIHISISPEEMHFSCPVWWNVYGWEPVASAYGQTDQEEYAAALYRRPLSDSAEATVLISSNAGSYSHE